MVNRFKVSGSEKKTCNQYKWLQQRAALNSPKNRKSAGIFEVLWEMSCAVGS